MSGIQVMTNSFLDLFPYGDPRPLHLHCQFLGNRVGSTESHEFNAVLAGKDYEILISLGFRRR